MLESTEPVYVYDMRWALAIGFIVLTPFEILLLYGFFVTGSYLTTPAASQYGIGITILLLLLLDVYMGYHLPRTLRLELYDDFLRAGRGSKARDFPYSDLIINNLKLESSRYGTYTEFTISSKSGDSK